MVSGTLHQHLAQQLGCLAERHIDGSACGLYLLRLHADEGEDEDGGLHIGHIELVGAIDIGGGASVAPLQPDCDAREGLTLLIHHGAVDGDWPSLDRSGLSDHHLLSGDGVGHPGPLEEAVHGYLERNVTHLE